MKYLLGIILFGFLIVNITCPPVQKNKEKGENPDIRPVEDDVNFGLEYERYLKEIVNVLETDEIFRKKLEDSNISDIKSGEIARHLEFVSHGVRTKLDELKRRELDRIRQLQRIKLRHQKGTNLFKLFVGQKPGVRFDPSEVMGHIDHANPHSFEVEDLAKLIQKATGDLELLDKQRKEEFKTYEMEKEHLRKERLKGFDGQKAAEEQAKFEEMAKKHKDHPKLHHPGSKDQLEEVWEESDGMNKDDFDPKTFFMMHDTNSDGFLDEEEVEALFQKELDKIYDPNAPEDDMMERYEEMNRMREHVFEEVDKNKDKLVSVEEFLESTKGDKFEKDEGWDTLDDEQIFTDEELAQFEKEYEEKQRKHFEGHAQPGEILIPVEPSHIPPQEDKLNVDHPAAGENQMNQQRRVDVPQPVHPQMLDKRMEEQRQHPNIDQLRQQAELAGGNPPVHQGQPGPGQGHGIGPVGNAAAAAEILAKGDFVIHHDQQHQQVAQQQQEQQHLQGQQQQDQEKQGQAAAQEAHKLDSPPERKIQQV